MLERPLRPVSPTTWDLALVLSFLRGPAFEPFLSQPLRVVTVKVLFLLSLATAKRMGELQAFTIWVVFQGNVISMSYIPEFVAKTRSERTPIYL